MVLFRAEDASLRRTLSVITFLWSTRDGYSVFATVFHSEYNGKKLNFIDCPGSDDFVGAAMTALNVTDTAVIVLNGQYGVEVGTQNHFRYTEKFENL